MKVVAGQYKREVPVKIWRGRIAGLLSSKFISQMLDMPEATVKGKLYYYLKQTGRRPWEMSPREVWKFMEDLNEKAKLSADDDIDNYLWF